MFNNKSTNDLLKELFDSLTSLTENEAANLCGYDDDVQKFREDLKYAIDGIKEYKGTNKR